MKIEIKHRWDGKTLWTGKADSLKAGLELAVKSSANLSFADLRSANLRFANLRSANLSFANLRFANLRFADLRSANLRSAKNADYAIAQTRILPEGDIIGWKKCENSVMVKMLIPQGVRRSHAFGRKCRAERVYVLDVIGAKVGISTHNSTTEYRKGATVSCDKWCDDFTQECAGGIHFFITRIEAENF